MFKLAIVALAVVVASATLETEFAVFKHKHNKTYKDVDEETYRFMVYQSNKQLIELHNKRFAAGESTYYLAENQFTDMTTDEFRRVMNGLRLNKELTPGSYESGLYKDTLPATVDWRTKGYVTPVKNQGQCGSCWAFSTTGSLEGAHFKSTGKLVSLSESNLVDCSSRWGNHGCNGGLMDQGFQYIIDNKGIDTEESYPYVARTRICKFNKKTIGSTETKYTDVTSGSEDALQQAVATVGPISVAIDASHSSFQMYGGGVYNEPECSSTQLDHGVLAVGYGTDGGSDYWLVKNSWGETWGESGYIRMSRNKSNQCGVASMASYPTV